MNLNKNIKHLFIFFSLCFLALGINLTYRQVFKADELARKPYYDKKFIQQMDSLIKGGIIHLEGDEIKLDDKKLQEVITNERIQKRVSDHLLYVENIHGTLKFDEQAVKIRDSRLWAEENFVIRGRFLDRNGKVLAENVINTKSGRQTRHYPYGSQFLTLIGHSNPVYGRRYLEDVLNDYLLGINQKSVFRKIQDFLRPFKVGNDVVLTIDGDLQNAAYELLGDYRGAVVLMDIPTGEVLALASKPSFDPGTAPGKEWIEAVRDRDEKSFLNRASSVLYPPGSTFKVIDVAAALETGIVDPHEKILCRGKSKKYKIDDWRTHGVVDLQRALMVSCNVYFAEMGVKLGEHLKDFAEKFGFNRSWDLIPRERSLKFPVQKSLAFAHYTYEERNDPKRDVPILASRVRPFTDFKHNPKIVAQCAIGQNLIVCTPLQMAMVASTIANDGAIMNPYIIREIRVGKPYPLQEASTKPEVGFFDKVRKFKPVRRGRAIEKGTARKLKGMMIDVMERGTGRGLPKIYDRENKLIPVAGKTGTAEVGIKGEKPHSWFIGFSPTDEPKFAICVIAENAGFGSKVAGPIAVEVLKRAFESQ